MAVFMMLLRFFTVNMNADGSLPTARWREMWKALFEAGDIKRAWCHHRFARMRNFLSDKDLLSWSEEEFVAGVLDEEVRFVPGRAAKWSASAELVSMMEQVEWQTVVGVGDCQDIETNQAESGSFVCGEFAPGGFEAKEEGENTLYGYKLQDQGQTEIKEEGESTLYGYTAYEIPILTPKSRQSTSFLEDLSHLGIEMPLQRPRCTGFSTSQYRMAA